MSDHDEMTAKTPYHAPEIVALGDVLTLTGALSTGVRDNHDSLGAPHYHNAEGDDPDQKILDLDD